MRNPASGFRALSPDAMAPGGARKSSRPNSFYVGRSRLC